MCKNVFVVYVSLLFLLVYPFEVIMNRKCDCNDILNKVM